MRYALYFSISIFFLGSKAFSQVYFEYYDIVNQAEIAFLDNQYHKADSLYQRAFYLVDRPFKEDYLLAAFNSNKLKESEKTFDYLINGIKQGLTLKRIKSKRKKLRYFTKSKHYTLLKKQYKLLREGHLGTLNISLKDEIDLMVKKDQRARMPILGSSRQMKKTDMFNYDRLKEIIKENGNKWPGFSTIGENTPKGKYNVTGNITLMLLHFSKEQIEFLKPYMFKAVMNGEMYPYQLARVIDYKTINTGKFCMIYGTYFGVDICDCKQAEIERKKIGFEPIQDYYRKVNAEYSCKE